MTAHSIPLSFPIELAILWSAKPTWTRGICGDVQVLRQGPQGSDVAQLWRSTSKRSGQLLKNSKIMKFGLQLGRNYPILLGWGIFELKSAVWTVKKRHAETCCMWYWYDAATMIGLWTSSCECGSTPQDEYLRSTNKSNYYIYIYIYIYQSQNPKLGGL